MFFKSIKMYWSLSQEQKKFIRNGGITAEMSIAKWVKLLESICRYDDIADTSRAVLTKWRNMSFGLVFFSFFIGFFSVFFTDQLTGLLIIPCSFSVAILMSIVSRLYNRIDVNDNVRQVIFPLLQMLALECGHQRKVRLAINFKKKLARADIAEKSKQGNTNTTIYDYEVLEADCLLIDNTKFSLKVIDTIRKRTVKKRSASGKTKFKTKYKLKRRIALVMGFNAQSYFVNTNKVGKQNIFKETEQKITYKQVLKQSSVGQTALIDIEMLLKKAHLPYSYLVAKVD